MFGDVLRVPAEQTGELALVIAELGDRIDALEAQLNLLRQGEKPGAGASTS